MTAAKVELPTWFTALGCCLPCLRGEHEFCRGNPDGRRFERGNKDDPCRCAEHQHEGGVGTCSEWVSGLARYGNGMRCSRPAKGTVQVSASFGSMMGQRETVTVERCGIHLAALRRVETNERRRQEEAAARQRASDAAMATSRAAEEWAERFRAEFGIDADGLSPRWSADLRIAVAPEKLYGDLVELLGLLRDAGVEDVPFRPEAQG